jgi:hypothetical protein
MCAIPSQSLHAECEVSAENAVTAEMTPTTQKTRGLCFDRKHQSWRCRIFYAGKQVRMGLYQDWTSTAQCTCSMHVATNFSIWAQQCIEHHR